jgi:hypothetical protein
MMIFDADDPSLVTTAMASSSTSPHLRFGQSTYM